MTHIKFIELLNLYLDHEISMEEAALLEAEIQTNPERRDLYRQYCRMQKGCAQLAGVFAEQDASEPAPRKFVPQAASRQRSFPVWTAGLGMAAAACAAFAIVMVSRSTQPVDAPFAAQTNAPQIVAAAPTAKPSEAQSVYSLAELTASRNELHSVYTPTLVNLSAPADQRQPLYANASAERFDWMDDVKLAPVSDTDEFSFQVRPVVAEGKRTYRSHRPIEGKVEMTAFQFQR